MRYGQNMTVYDNISFGLKNIKEELPVMDIELKTTSDVNSFITKYK